MAPPRGGSPRGDPRIWQDALDVGAWVLTHMSGPAPLAARVQLRAFDLVEAAALAMSPSIDRLDALFRLDGANVVLRADLRLAERCELLDAVRYTEITGRLDAIGRQVGGWIRSELAQVELERGR